MAFLPTNAFVVHRQTADSWSTFIDFWDKTYDYLADNLDYERYVVKRDSSFTFNPVNLRKLFEWKNKTGENLTAKKEATVDGLINKIDDLNILLVSWDEVLFKQQFGKISAVWQTFLMHIIQPNQFPIFDQHVYRAYTYLQTGKADELTSTNKQKLRHYEVYRSFFDAVRHESGCNPRHLDKAFWAFGKFLKQYNPLT